jgi:ribonuclease P protein component
MPKKFTLDKRERLKSRKEINMVFSEGKSFLLFPFKVFYWHSVPQAPKNIEIGTLRKATLVQNLKPRTQNLKTSLQFGVGVSGKLFPRAVDRNQIKRLAREAYRLQKFELQEKVSNTDCRLVVFFTYISKELADFQVIWEKTGLILKKLSKLADEKKLAEF